MTKIGIVIGLVLIVFLGIFFWWRNGAAAPSPDDTSEQVFVIPKGEAIRQVGNDLKEAGLIKDPVVFFLTVRLEGVDTAIQAGSYKLSPSMNLNEVLDTLQHGTIDIWVTVPEGYRAEEVAETLAETIPTYDDSWVGVLKENEGYLFPDTYLVPNDATADQVVAIMSSNLATKLEPLGLTLDSPQLYRILTIASLIEREALTDEEKPMVASVIHNRLNNGMALDIDATLQYIKGGDNGNWWSVPTGEDRRLNSPYNTYQNPGLPPTPIANPGIVAIEAALNPADSSYYFYIHAPDGTAHFAETLAEHNRNVERYLR